MQTRPSTAKASPKTKPPFDRLNPGEIAREIEPVVLELIGVHETLIGALERHREAIGAADPRTIGPLIEEERAHFARIAELDRRARLALGHAPRTVNGATPASGGLRITELADRLGGEDGARLRASAEYLRVLVKRADALRGSVRDASAAMAAHLDGLMRQVAQRLSHAGTYGSAGTVESKASVVSGLDVSL
jgi:hypothetical protein